MTKTYTEHPYPLVAQWHLQNWKFHPFFSKVLRLLNSEAPELDVEALPVLLKMSTLKRMPAQLSGRRERV